jgi:7-cyano-7-deazaguanine synthase
MTSDVYSLNIQYAQASIHETEASRRIAEAARVKEHITVQLPFYKEIQDLYHPDPSAKVSSAYVPARNLVFYSIAIAYAEALQADTIVFGSNLDDAAVLPDATPKFIRRMNELLRMGTRMGVEGRTIEILNPFINLDKQSVLRLSVKLEVPLELTWSCYQDAFEPCGKCRGCQTRREAFAKLGIQDPVRNSTV